MNCDFPKRLASARKKRGISQKQAAAALGVSQALLSHYEKGIRECGLDFVVKVSQYYNVSCDYLLGGSNDSDGDRFSKRELVRVLNTVLSTVSKNTDTVTEKYCNTYMNLAIYRLLRILSDASAKERNAALTNAYQTDRMADGYMQMCVAKLMKQFESGNFDTESELKNSAEWNAILSVVTSSEKLLSELNFDKKES